MSSRLLRVFAWLSFIGNIVIIATGGAVRLTGSGLGCTDWPLCTADSLVTTPEMGFHGVIEFANRTLTGPLLIFAIVVFWLSLRIRAQRKDLFILSSIVLGLVLLQALVGGIVVWMHLHANLVGLHYTLTIIIVAVAAAYVARMYEQPGPRERAVPLPYAILTHVSTLFMALTIFVGVLTTGAGPHSGDASVERDGFDATVLAHVHAWPGYTLLALIIVLTLWAWVRKLRPFKWALAVLAVLAVQILVGVYQARNGLPVLAVGVHMVLAGLSAASMTVLVLSLKRRVEGTPPETDKLEAAQGVAEAQA